MSRVAGLAELIRHRVLRGELVAGELVVGAELADAFRVSRATVREALRLLEGRGLLEANESGGMRVAALDPAELAEAVRVRAALEALAATEAAERSREGGVGAGDLRRVFALGGACEAAAADPDPRAGVLADRALHLAIAALADNRPARFALDHVWDRIVVASLRLGLRSPDGAAVAEEHRALLAAIADGDGDEAAALARRHALHYIRNTP